MTVTLTTRRYFSFWGLVLALSLISGALINGNGAQAAPGKFIALPNGVASSILSSHPKQPRAPRLSFVAGEVLVQFKPARVNLKQTAGRNAARQLLNRHQLKEMESYAPANFVKVKVPDSAALEQTLTKLKADPDVEIAEPNYFRYSQALPNDTFFNTQWALNNASPAAADAVRAWDLSTGTPRLVVAVIDSGVNYYHPDLKNKMWDGSVCRDENNIATTCPNYGWNFAGGNNDPFDFYGHGTAVASVIAAETNNSKGIAGVDWNAKIMALKVGESDTFALSDIIKAIDFAVNNQVKIINASYSNQFFSLLEHQAIKRFTDAGGIFVTAAGNEANDNDTIPVYPAGYDLPNIITVGWLNQSGELSPFSNYGSRTVDLAAPGEDITVALATSTLLLGENFSDVATGTIPAGWSSTVDDSWAVFDIGNKVLYSDEQTPYRNNANYYLTLPPVSVGPVRYANFNFVIGCDTDEDLTAQADYLALEVSSNGAPYDELARWNESTLAADPYSVILDPYVFNLNKLVPLPQRYFNSNLQARFHWVTDNNTDPASMGNACLIDDLTLTQYDGSEAWYDAVDGTSFSAPLVAGAASLLWGYRSNLTATQVSQTLLATGTTLPALAGKVATGKTLNIFAALQSVTPVTHNISGKVRYYDGIKAIAGVSVALTLESNGGQAAQLVATTTTDNVGFYQFTGVPAGGNYVVRMVKNEISRTALTKGLSGADQGKIGRHIVGLEIFNSIYKIIAGDVNNSGGLSGADQGKIGRFIVGLDASLLSGTWKFYDASAAVNITNYLTTGLVITYANLTADQASQDFVGIKMGDVNNSWVQ